jgi:hypothetical protein
MIAATAPKIEDLTLNIAEEIHVKAPLDVTFETLLEQLGSGMTTVVSRLGRQQRSLLGARAGDQAAHAD